jgi:hypothetical protein
MSVGNRLYFRKSRYEAAQANDLAKLVVHSQATIWHTTPISSGEHDSSFLEAQFKGEFYMLTNRMQIQEIANVLADLEPTLSLRDFQEPWKSAYEAVLETPREQRKQALVDALQERPDCDALVGVIFAAMPGAQLGSYPSLDAIADNLRPIEWLWRNWIPRAMLSMLTAAPGAGKSLLALDLSKRIIEGSTFPDGSDITHAGAPVIYVDAEAVPQLLNERAEAWQMDKAKLYVMLPDTERLYIDLAAPTDRDHLVEMTHQVGPELIIIDSLSTISSKGENNIEDVRVILSFLNQLAGHFDCGMLLIHHLRKRSQLAMMDMITLDDLRGSSHIGAMARSVLALSIVQDGPEMDRNGPRRLDLIKTNLAAYPDPIGVYLMPMDPKGVFLRYDAPPTRYREPSDYEKCATWLLDLLEEHGEPMKPKEVVELAAEEGFSRSIVYRARKQLDDKIVNTKGHRNPRNKWALPEQLEEEL